MCDKTSPAGSSQPVPSFQEDTGLDNIKATAQFMDEWRKSQKNNPYTENIWTGD